jgi:hypothetical protein
MNRLTRLSMIIVLALATTALGIMGWNAMHPSPTSEPVLHAPPQPVEIPEASPRPNPEFEKLQADLSQHERRCLQLVKQATILLNAQSQNQSQSQAEQRVKECWNLVKIEQDYVKNFSAKTIQ